MLGMLACGGPADEVLLLAEGDGTLCLDEAGTTLSVFDGCAITCTEAVWQGRCEARLANTSDGALVVFVQSEILVKQPEGCPATTCEEARVSCPVPADAQGLRVVWGEEVWTGIGELETCPTVLSTDDTG